MRRIILTDPEAVEMAGCHHDRGASKQVAFELARREWARTREYLAEMREAGWSVWDVICEFGGEKSSVSGVIIHIRPTPSEREHLNEMVLMVACEVATTLIKRGLIVAGRPNTQARHRDNLRRFLHANLHSQDWI